MDYGFYGFNGFQIHQIRNLWIWNGFGKFLRAIPKSLNYGFKKNYNVQ